MLITASHSSLHAHRFDSLTRQAQQMLWVQQARWVSERPQASVAQKELRQM